MPKRRNVVAMGGLGAFALIAWAFMFSPLPTRAAGPNDAVPGESIDWQAAIRAAGPTLSGMPLNWQDRAFTGNGREGMLVGFADGALAIRLGRSDVVDRRETATRRSSAPALMPAGCRSGGWSFGRAGRLIRRSVRAARSTCGTPRASGSPRGRNLSAASPSNLDSPGGPLRTASGIVSTFRISGWTRPRCNALPTSRPRFTRPSSAAVGCLRWSMPSSMASSAAPP